MTIRVPNSRKSPAQAALERSIAGKNSAVVRLRQALEGAGKALTQEAGVGQLSQITPALGDVTSGTFWAIDDDGRVRLVLSADSIFEQLGVAAYLAGFDTDGNPQFWIDADTGAAVFGGGATILNRLGFNSYGLGYSIQQNAEFGGYQRWGRLEMLVPEGGDRPVWALSFNGPPGTNLLSNGDFSGGLTDWTKTTETDGGTWGGADGHAIFSGNFMSPPPTLHPHGVLTHTRFSVTAEATYQIIFSGIATDTLSTQLVTAAWYTASSGGTLLRSDTVYSGIFTTSWKEYIANLVAPSGATHLDILLTANCAAVRIGIPQPPSQNVMFDDVTVTQLAVNQRVYLEDGGFTMDGSPVQSIVWGNQLTTGTSYDRDGVSNFATQIMVLRVLDPIKLSGFEWYVRATGTYALHLLWSPNIANSWRQIWTASVGTAGWTTMTLTTPEVLMPGLYYIGLTRTSGAALWGDKDLPTYTPATPSWRFEGVYYNTTSYDYVPACRLLWKKGTWR